MGRTQPLLVILSPPLFVHSSILLLRCIASASSFNKSTTIGSDHDWYHHVVQPQVAFDRREYVSEMISFHAELHIWVSSFSDNSVYCQVVISTFSSTYFLV